MATMLPNDLSGCEKASEGDRLVYSSSKEIAKPDRDLSAGNPKERRDFIVYCRRHGLIVVEVKDWAAEQIHKANPLSFTLRISGKYEKRDNPFRQRI